MKAFHLHYPLVCEKLSSKAAAVADQRADRCICEIKGTSPAVAALHVFGFLAVQEGGTEVVPDHSTPDVTQLLHAVSEGDSNAAEQLLPLIYDELRKLAAARMAREPGAGAGMTLQPTALVHEAYLRLVTPPERKGPGAEPKWNGRGHFFGAAALAMRRILVERARHSARIKHGGELRRVELTDQAVAKENDGTDLVALDEALEKLQAYDERKAQVVLLRYFAGLSIEETAAAMELSPATVKNEWTFARAWLHREMTGRPEGAADTHGRSP